MAEKNYCLYYVARIEKKRAWLLASIVRGTEHVSFDRALHKSEREDETTLFEFFVPKAMESVFSDLIDYLKKEGMVLSIEKQDNRYKEYL